MRRASAATFWLYKDEKWEGWGGKKWRQRKVREECTASRMWQRYTQHLKIQQLLLYNIFFSISPSCGRGSLRAGENLHIFRQATHSLADSSDKYQQKMRKHTMAVNVCFKNKREKSSSSPVVVLFSCWHFRSGGSVGSGSSCGNNGHCEEEVENTI